MKVQLHSITMQYSTLRMIAEDMALHSLKPNSIVGYSDGEHVLHCAVVMMEDLIDSCKECGCDLDYIDELTVELDSLLSQEKLRCELSL